MQLRVQHDGSGTLCREILATLPTWFGIEDAVDHYVDVAERSWTLVASVDDGDVGLLTILRHSPYAAEIYVMGVVPERHRQGIGASMLRHTEETLLAEGVEYLQVKTLSDKHPDEGYKRTRAFYMAQGFRVLEEFPELWSTQNPALQLVKALR